MAANDFYFGEGFVTATKGARAKWNYQGKGFKLLAPQNPEYGVAELMVDGIESGHVNFASTVRPSSCFFSKSLPADFHCVILQVKQGLAPLDILEITPD